MKAVEIGSRTLVGGRYTGPGKGFNCFDMVGEDGKDYDILNFYAEDLNAVMEKGLDFPFEIRVLEGRSAVMDDIRIPHEYYRKNFCSVCTPTHLLPLPQKLQYERMTRTGEIEERGKIRVIDYSKGAKL